MAKVGFCAVSGSGMSALAQISKYMGNDVYGSDRSFDQGKDLHNKLALEKRRHKKSFRRTVPCWIAILTFFMHLQP